MNKKLLLKILRAFLLISIGIDAYASSHPGLFTLTWANKSERLTYRSCGCADSCWVAKLRERKTLHIKAILSCNCENLYFIFPINSKEEALGKSCNKINDSSDKFKLISDEIKSIIESKSKSKFK
jgi:hypothetical protein